jgi:hypothetical protein
MITAKGSLAILIFLTPCYLVLICSSSCWTSRTPRFVCVSSCLRVCSHNVFPSFIVPKLCRLTEQFHPMFWACTHVNGKYCRRRLYYKRIQPSCRTITCVHRMKVVGTAETRRVIRLTSRLSRTLFYPSSFIF